MTKDEVLKLALDALEHEAEISNDNAYKKERDAILEALAQPEQEPVAWTDMAYARLGMVRDKMSADAVATVQGFLEGNYTTPPQPTVKQSLTVQPEQINTIRALTEQCATLVWERDELKKQVQRYERNGVTCQTYGHKVDSSCSECNVHAHYTTPPQRKPLTNEEIMDIAMNKPFDSAIGFARAIEAAHGIKENT